MEGHNKDKLSASDPESPFSEPVILPIEDRLDLHPFSPKDLSSVVEEYIDQCVKLGMQEIRLIHGRGKGVQRRIIRSLLEKHPQVSSFNDAPPEAGGWGATVVVLKKDLQL
jgi:DNA-nicking Smr family endonuclease